MISPRDLFIVATQPIIASIWKEPFREMRAPPHTYRKEMLASSQGRSGLIGEKVRGKVKGKEPKYCTVL
jgi:hypothetical protein